MKDIFASGDVKSHNFQVSEDHLAQFEIGLVHPVCSTFVLAREIEWSSRLFVLEMCEETEEGVGTMLQIDHKSPAFVGDAVMIQATVESLLKNELICSIEVKVGDRLIATGKTSQKIMSKEKINQIFTSLDR